MFLREMIILVQNCSFREMIISDNTERGNVKLTRCSCRKKVHETENSSLQGKIYISAEVFFLLTCDQVFCLVSVFASVHGGLDPIAIQSNHLLGKTMRHTHGTLASQFN